MSIAYLISALPLLLSAACGTSTPAVPVRASPILPTRTATTTPLRLPSPTPAGLEIEPTSTTILGLGAPGAASGPDCLGEALNPIASEIAADYTFTTYVEVMTWFCNGAEFEDILTALLTEDLTGEPAEEMLEMLANGFTWEEVWQLTGVTE